MVVRADVGHQAACHLGCKGSTVARGFLHSGRHMECVMANVETSQAEDGFGEGELPDRRSGFSLIELMIVTLIVGLLAAIALPKFGEVQARAQFAAISNDLRNLGSSQERFHQTRFTYATSLTQLDFVPTEGVEVEVIEASPSGWAAWATHASFEEGKGCSIYLGAATPPPLPNGQPHGGAPGLIRCVQ